MLAWWYAVGDKPAGPVAIDGLAQLFHTGRIDLQTRVWHEGMAAWSPIAALPELQGVVVPLAPMPARMPPPPPPPAQRPAVMPHPHVPHRTAAAQATPVKARPDDPPGWVLPAAGVMVLLAAIVVSVAVWLHHRSAAAPVQTVISQDNGGAWENPFNHRRAAIDPQWHTAMEEGVLNFKRDRDSVSASLQQPMELGNETFEEFVREWDNGNPEENRQVGTLNGVPVLNYDRQGREHGSDTLLAHYQLIFVGHQIWSILTFRRQSDTGSEADLERLRADIRHSFL